MKSRVKQSKRFKNVNQIALPYGRGGIRDKKKKSARAVLLPGDWVLLATVLVLGTIGLVMVYHSSSLLAERTYGDSFYFIKKQLQWILLGVLAFFVTSRFDTAQLHKWVGPMAAIVFVMLISVLIFGADIKGSRRWLGLGLISLQPSEIAKLFTVIYLAHYITKKSGGLKHFVDGAAPPLIVIGSMASLILVEPDLGTTVVILSITLTLLFLGGIPIRQFMAMVGIVLPFIYYWIVSSPYRLERLLTFWDPWKEPYGSGFQVIQSHIALGSGGVTGTGLAEGKQILFFLPEPHTDFIFAVIGEAFGLLGTIGVLFLFVSILWRGTRIAIKVETPFNRLLAVGMTLLITLPALLNMGVVSGLLPTKGLPLPFLSYGGSSLLVNCIAVGFLYNLSRGMEGMLYGWQARGNSIWEGLS